MLQRPYAHLCSFCLLDRIKDHYKNHQKLNTTEPRYIQKRVTVNYLNFRTLVAC